jgi:type IV pilus assembly protein PilM
MDWGNLKKRIGMGGRTHTGRFVAPAFALDLEPGFVAAARLNTSKRLVQSVGVRELPAGALAPSPNKSNIADVAAMRRTISEVVQKVGNSGSRVGLLIPDAAARIALLQFETLPDDSREAETLVLWRMREFLPYTPEEARLTFQVVDRQSGSLEVLVVAVRESVLAEYEAGMEGVNGAPALVLPASVALLPLLPDGDGGQLLIHLSTGSLTAVVVASSRLRYWRTRALGDDLQANLAEVARETSRVLATCQDNLGVQIENVWYCDRTSGEGKPAIARALAQTVGHELQTLPPKFLPPAGLPSGQREVFEQFGMPFAGLLANLD